MPKRFHNYVRTYRKRDSLTQDELAFLLGASSGAKLSRIERLSRPPSLKLALACQVIFGVPAHELFEGLFTEVEQKVTERARTLAQKITKRGVGAGVERKIRVVNGIVARDAGALTQSV